LAASDGSRSVRAADGQASVELAVALAGLVGTVALAWQIVLLAAAADGAQADVRRAALSRPPESGTLVRLHRERPVPSILPGFGGARVRAHGAIGGGGG
jgi:hypothetical protein